GVVTFVSLTWSMERGRKLSRGSGPPPLGQEAASAAEPSRLTIAPAAPSPRGASQLRRSIFMSGRLGATGRACSALSEWKGHFRLTLVFHCDNFQILSF